MSVQEPPEHRPPVAPPGLGYAPGGYPPPAPASRGRRLLWLWLTLGVVAVVLVAAGTILVVLARRWDGRPVKGDVAITLRLSGPDGAAPPAAALEQTKKILLSRMGQIKAARATVTAIGGDTLLVTAARADAERVRAVLVPGNLTFRKVLGSVATQGDTGCEGGQPARVDRAAALASAKAKLGAVYDAAAAIQDPGEPDAEALTGFDALTCAEIAALPARMQYAVPAITCAMLNGRPAGALDDTGTGGAACDRERTTKYLLDVAKVTGTDLAAVDAQLDQGRWVVNLRFTAAGQPKWTELTREVMNDGQRNGENGAVGVLLDNEVLTAPQIQSVITGEASISGGDLDNRQRTEALAATLSHGALPLRLVITSMDTVR
jgi:preprotein translocase subunit SecD